MNDNKEDIVMKKIISAVLVTTMISTSAMACTPRYKSAVPDVMARVRVQAAKAGAAVKTSDNSYLQAALAAAAAAGAAAGSAVASGK